MADDDEDKLKQEREDEIRDGREEELRPARGRLGWRGTLAVCVLILLAAGGLTTLIFFTEPKATRGDTSKETAMLVEVVAAERGNYRPEIEAMGTVMPVQDIMLSPRVSGMVIELAEGFTPGGFVKEGEVLLKIDPADFRNTLQQRESELRRVMAALEIERGQQNVARQGYELLDEGLSPENEALVLREPQLDTARADVESARAAVDQAKLDLERTTIEAPFDAHVLSREVGVGSQVSPEASLGRLVAIDTYWVEVTVPLSRLEWLAFEDEEEGLEGSTARIRNQSAWPDDAYREGRLFKLVGALEEQTRMARVLVTVDDPLAREEQSAGQRPLIVGSFVEAHIQAREIRDVIRLDRDYVHKNDTVWVMKDGKLEIREAEIEFTGADYAYIKGGLEEGDQVVTTNLSTIAEGAKLRLEGEDSGGNAGRADEGREEKDDGDNGRKDS